MLTARLSFWFGFDAPVDRRTYVLNGAGLMACKYLMDAAVVGAFTGRLFTPLDISIPSGRCASKLCAALGREEP